MNNKLIYNEKSLVYYYLDSFIEVHRGVMKTHINFIQVEAQSQNSYFNQIKGAQTNLEKDVALISEEMIRMKSDSGSMRQTLNFLSKNELIISMPSQLKKHYNRNDFERISKLFQQAFPYLKRYKGMKIFSQVFMEIDRILQMSQDLVISHIEKNLENKRKMTEYTNILLDLQYDYQGDTNILQQKSHIVTAKPSYFLPPDLTATGGGANALKRGSAMPFEQEESHNLIKMITYLEKKLAENIKMNTDMNFDKSGNEEPNNFIIQSQTGLTNLSEQEDRMRKLKMINSILFDSDRLVNFMYKNNVSDNQRQLKIKDIESYFTENMPRFDNFYTLLESYQEGEYDYKLPAKSGKSQQTRKALKHFQVIFESLRKAAQKCVEFVEMNYNFKNKASAQKQIFELKEEELNNLRNQIVHGKEDVICCSNIIFLLKQLDQRVKIGGKQVLELQERTLKIAYIVELHELKIIQLEKYDFYSNMSITKTFTNDDEFISPFSNFLYESLLNDVQFITSLKVFRPNIDLFTLDTNFLLEAISICFRSVFLNVMKEHQRLQEEESEFSQATGNYSYLSISTDEVYLILLSNIISFQQSQCRLLLQQIFDSQLKSNTKSGNSTTTAAATLSSSGTIIGNNPEKIMNSQVKQINQLMEQMVADLKKKLSYTKAQLIVKECHDIFTPWFSQSEQMAASIEQNQPVTRSLQRSTTLTPATLSPTGTTANNLKFDANTVYNISILQQLAPAAPGQEINMQNLSLAKYEIRYKVLDLLSEFDQYLETISLNCCQILAKVLPPLLLVEILQAIKKILEDKQKNTNVLMLKQLRIELEFLQEATVEIKSVDSQSLFLAIYSLLDKIFKEKFSQSPINEQLYRIDPGKLKDIIRITKYKSKLNFKFFN